MKRHNHSSKEEKKHRFHDELVQRILNNPEMIIIDGNPIESQTIKAKAGEISLGNNYKGTYRVDIAIIREIEPRIGELDIIEALSTPYGKGMSSACKSLKGKLLPFYMDFPSQAVRQLKEKMCLNDDYCNVLYLDVHLSYPGDTGLIKFERLPGYKKKRIVKDGDSWHYVKNAK